MSTGKGSLPRPYSVPADEFAARHEAIFGRKDRKVYVPPPLPKQATKEKP